MNFNEHYTKDSTLMPEKLSIDLTLETVLDPERPPCITQTHCEKWPMERFLRCKAPAAHQT
jgi:hypothetical protein